MKRFLFFALIACSSVKPDQSCLTTSGQGWLWCGQKKGTYAVSNPAKPVHCTGRDTICNVSFTNDNPQPVICWENATCNVTYADSVESPKLVECSGGATCTGKYRIGSRYSKAPKFKCYGAGTSCSLTGNVETTCWSGAECDTISSNANNTYCLTGSSSAPTKCTSDGTVLVCKGKDVNCFNTDLSQKNCAISNGATCAYTYTKTCSSSGCVCKSGETCKVVGKINAVCKKGSICTGVGDAIFTCLSGSKCLVKGSAIATCNSGATCRISSTSSQICKSGSTCYASHNSNVTCDSGATCHAYDTSNLICKPGSTCYSHNNSTMTCSGQGTKCTSYNSQKFTCKDKATCTVVKSDSATCTGSGTKCHVKEDGHMSCTGSASCISADQGTMNCNFGAKCVTGSTGLTKCSGANTTCCGGCRDLGSCKLGSYPTFGPRIAKCTNKVGSSGTWMECYAGAYCTGHNVPKFVCWNNNQLTSCTGTGNSTMVCNSSSNEGTLVCKAEDNSSLNCVGTNPNMFGNGPNCKQSGSGKCHYLNPALPKFYKKNPNWFLNHHLPTPGTKCT